MSNRVKKCPKCGFWNDEFAYFCEKPECKESLMNVAAVNIDDTSQEKETGFRYNDKPQTSKKGQLPDNVKNTYTKHLPNAEARLECLSQPGFAFKVFDQGIIGRQGDIDVSCLENCLYISRLHACFFLAEGKWYLQNLSETNKTMVNNARVPHGFRQVLSDGDRITLANSSFLFRVMNQ
ncbi:MAG: FHA domain protein [Pelotomaculum sp. PtaU1.Bin035]|nr:MAG: FHA domain protein [Pelotomaculum sp. PtaU1.Bin035]